jgi:LuxR family transcriptional regulator, maltose regulon positive regulatory protein
MAKTTPKVQRKQLRLNGEESPLCDLDSPAWFAWLAVNTSFRHFSQQRKTVASHITLPMRPISVRKEKRRRGYIWYAYIRTYGLLHKRYVGKSESLTADRLDEIAAHLNEIW